MQTEDDRGEVRERLVDELERARAMLASLEREEREVMGSQLSREVRVDGAGGDGDYLSVERGRIRTSSARIVERISTLEHSLAELDSGSYGLCDVCGEPIDPERLEALPGCRECMDCKRSGR